MLGKTPNQMLSDITFAWKSKDKDLFLRKMNQAIKYFDDVKDKRITDTLDKFAKARAAKKTNKPKELKKNTDD